jgi:hypothetical protein
LGDLRGEKENALRPSVSQERNGALALFSSENGKAELLNN